MVRKKNKQASYFNIYTKISFEFIQFSNGNHMKIIKIHDIYGAGKDRKLDKQILANFKL